MKPYYLLCLAALCAACSPAKTEKAEVQPTPAETAPETAQAPADAPEAAPAPEAEAAPAAESPKAEAPAAPKEESWPSPKPMPQLPELKSDYWPDTVDGYFPPPIFQGKPVPLKKGTCEADEDKPILYCSFGGKYTSLYDSYADQLKEAGFESTPASGVFVKRQDGEPVRTVEMIIGGGDLNITLGAYIAGSTKYNNPDDRFPYPLQYNSVAIEPADSIEITGNAAPIRTYIYNASFYKPPLFQEDYAKRLEDSGFKKVDSYPLYISKAEDGTFLSVVIEPKCFTMTMDTRKNEECISMSKSKLEPVDAADPLGLYKNLPDSSIPTPDDGQMALKYRTRSEENGVLSFVYGKKDGPGFVVIHKDIAAAYESKLTNAGFKQANQETSQSSDMDIETKTYTKSSDDGKTLTVTVIYESPKANKNPDGHYKLMTIKMGKD